MIEDRGGNQPPDLTDDKWDHGSSDGEIFTVVKKGIAPDFFMAPWEGRISDEIWNMVNYVKSLSQRSETAVMWTRTNLPSHRQRTHVPSALQRYSSRSCSGPSSAGWRSSTG